MNMIKNNKGQINLIFILIIIILVLGFVWLVGSGKIVLGEGGQLSITGQQQGVWINTEASCDTTQDCIDAGAEGETRCNAEICQVFIDPVVRKEVSVQ